MQFPTAAAAVLRQDNQLEGTHVDTISEFNLVRILKLCSLFF